MAAKPLDLQQAPPISVPLRFFLTAPAFALAAAAVALWYGADAFASRWTPATLAATHLIALGCATMIMVGALLQIMPVLAGAPFARPRAVATVVHATLTLGTIVLACAFLHGERALFIAAAALLGAAFAVFVAAMAHALSRGAVANFVIPTLRLVAAALAIAVALGVWLALGRGLAIAPALASLPDLHPGWALLGWIGLLVAAVGRRIVPMFQLTPDYPERSMRAFGWAVLAALVAWSIGMESGASFVAVAAAFALAGAYVAFAATTLRLQWRRRRRQFDANVRFWQIGMACAIAAALAWIASLALDLPPAFAVATGVLALAGAALSIVNGMLYRVVPFLAWYHLYARFGTSPYVPHLKDYLAERRQRAQLALHAASVMLLLAATAWPDALARLAALAFAASSALWLANLIAVAQVYRGHARALTPPPRTAGAGDTIAERAWPSRTQRQAS